MNMVWGSEVGVPTKSDGRVYLCKTVKHFEPLKLSKF